MRKLFTFFAALMAVVAVNATVVTLNPSDFTPVTTAAAINQTVNGITVAIDNGIINDSQIRIYKGKSITLSAASPISAVVFTCTANGTSQYGPGCFEAKDGYSYEGKVGTWVGTPATSVAFTASTAQVRAAKIEVYLDGETPGAVEPATYDTLTVAKAVEIANALGDNVTSEQSYVIDGFAVNVYEYSTSYKNQDFFLVDDAAQPDSVLKVFRATPTKGGKAYPVVEGDQVRLLGNLMKYVKDGKVQLEITNSELTFLNEAPRDTTSGGDDTTAVVTVDTITVAKALEIGKALADKGVTTKEYVIKGYVSDIKDYYSEQYGNETFWITDTKGERTNDKTKAFEVYRGKPNTGAEIGLDALIQIQCKIKNYSGTIENDGTNIVFEVLEQGSIDEVEKVTVAQAMEIGKALASGATTEKRYEITGYVSNVYTFFNPDYSNETVWLTDDPESTSADAEVAFQVFRGKPSTKAELGYGAKVKVVTTITNYGGTTIESASGVAIEVLEASTFVPEELTVEEAVAAVLALEEGKKAPKYSIVKGFIQEVVTPYDADKNIATYKLADFPNEAEGALQAYKATVLKDDAEKLVLNNYVVITGYLMKKNGGAQIAQGAITAFAEAPKADTIHVSVAEAVEIGLALPVEGKTDKIYAVTGYVTSVIEEFEAGMESFYMADEAGSELSNFFASAARLDRAVAEGDKVQLIGRLQHPDDEIVSVDGGTAVYVPGEGIEQIVLTEKAQKVAVDGQLFIIRDGKMYNAQGAQVR